MEEVDVHLVDGCVELPDFVETVLKRSPVVAGEPVLDELAQVAKRYASVPAVRVGLGADIGR